MAKVAEEMREGRLRISEEHLASQLMTEALLQLRPGGALAAAADAPQGHRPRAVVGAMEGDQHHLGALCVRLVLDRHDWDVLYLGPDVPIEDFASVQRAFDAELVCLSFSPPASSADMKRAVRILGEFYHASKPYALVLGGSAEARWEDLAGIPGPFSGLRLVSDCTTLEAALLNGLGEATKEAPE